MNYRAEKHKSQMEGKKQIKRAYHPESKKRYVEGRGSTNIDQLQTQMGNWEIKKLNKKDMDPKGATADADGYLLKEEERHEHKRRTAYLPAEWAVSVRPLGGTWLKNKGETTS